MALFLSQLGYLELSTLGVKLQALAQECHTQEAYAAQVCHFLHAGLIELDERPSTALVRCFLTLPYRLLPPGLASLAQERAGVPLEQDTNCLTLIGTAGVEPAWNHRAHSVSHQVIPLTTSAALDRLPMVRELLAQLRLNVSPLDPTVPMLNLGDERRGDRIFFIQDALESPHIPSKADFIRPYGVASVLGFGDVLENGQGFAVLLFCRPRIGEDMAPFFRILTRQVRNGLESLKDRPIFED